MANIAVAISGGVDSLGALIKLKQARHDVLAIHGLFLPDSTVPPTLAQTCKTAGADFIVLDLREQFQLAVMHHFNEEYASGRTPNPCAICNRAIKFGALLKYALEQGADRFATGHYVALDSARYSGPVLSKCADSAKDQAYFLALVEAQNLRSAMFPLAGQTKAQTRQQVAKAGFTPPCRTESQDICFLANTPRAVSRFKAAPGPILLRTERDAETSLKDLPEIGIHNGLDNFTIGQRKGLGIPWFEPLYARELYPETNSLVVSPRKMLGIKGVTLRKLNFFINPKEWPRPIFVRLRHRQPLTEANIDFSGSEAKIELKQACFTTAPGQVGAIYDQSGLMLAGGLIAEIIHQV